MPTLRRILPAVALVWLAIACAGSGAVASDPGQAFAQLEARLLEAPAVLAVSQLTSEGAFEADLRSEHLITSDGRGRVKAVGTFGGRPVDVLLEFDGQRMTLTSTQGTRELPQPSDLRGGLLLGLTRMGWLHNVAMLTAGAAPDATDGSVREFTRPVGLRAGETLEDEGRPRRALTFGVEVKGELAASAVLWLDLETGRPLERWQKVSFPEGEMRVIETYEVLDLDPDLQALGL